MPCILSLCHSLVPTPKGNAHLRTLSSEHTSVVDTSRQVVGGEVRPCVDTLHLLGEGNSTHLVGRPDRLVVLIGREHHDNTIAYAWYESTSAASSSFTGEFTAPLSTTTRERASLCAVRASQVTDRALTVTLPYCATRRLYFSFCSHHAPGHPAGARSAEANRNVQERLSGSAHGSAVARDTKSKTLIIAYTGTQYTSPAGTGPVSGPVPAPTPVPGNGPAPGPVPVPVPTGAAYNQESPAEPRPDC